MSRITKILFSVFPAIPIAFLFLGCSEDRKVDMPPPVEPYLRVETGLLPLSSHGERAELVFSTNESWGIVTETEDKEKDWYRVLPLSGDAGEDIRVTVEVDSNHAYTDRTFSLILKSESLEERIAVRQLKKNVILLGENRYEISFEEQTLTVEVRSNVSYLVEIGEDAEWIREEAGLHSGELNRSSHCFRISRNGSASARTGVIVFTDPSSALSDELFVVQSGWEDPTPELTALKSIYECAGGPGWTHSDNWCSDAPLSDWYGVKTDADGHVTGLRLSHNNLSGIISEKISQLSYLQHLDLSWNDLGGEISKLINGEVCNDLDNLTELETINLSHNNITGEFMPTNWYKLERLKRIDLSSNQLKCFAFPLKWGSMFENGRTVDLILNNNYLYDDIPKVIQNHRDWNRLALQMIRQNRTGSGGLRYDKAIYLPDFTFTDLSDGSERSIREVYSGSKLTMLLHWDPLQSSSGEFISTTVRRLHTLFGGQGFSVVGITPEGDDYREAARRYMREHNITWTAVTDYRDAEGRRIVLPDYPYPSYLLIDGSGKLQMDMFNGQYIPPQPNLGESSVMDLLTFIHADYINLFFKDLFGESTYESRDYTMDKQYETLQRASKGSGIDIVVVGEAFTDIDIETGFYRDVMKFALESFFSIEPAKTYRDYFNVYMVYAVSRKAYIGDDRDQVALGTIVDLDQMIDNRLDKLPDYVYRPVVSGNTPFVSVVINNNSSGLTWMGKPYIRPSYSFSGYPPGNRRYLRGNLLHETIGHGFGLLGDEYSDGYVTGEIPDYRKDELKASQKKGWCYNVSLTNDPHSVYWSHLIGHARYPYVGIYQGGYYYDLGVWRSEDKSVMRDSKSNLYFNAICRELIVKRILELSGEEYTFEKFLEKDSDEGRPGEGSSGLGLFRSKGNGYVHHPPIVMDEL